MSMQAPQKEMPELYDEYSAKLLQLKIDMIDEAERTIQLYRGRKNIFLSNEILDMTKSIAYLEGNIKSEENITVNNK